MSVMEMIKQMASRLDGPFEYSKKHIHRAAGKLIEDCKENKDNGGLLEKSLFSFYVLVAQHAARRISSMMDLTDDEEIKSIARKTFFTVIKASYPVESDED